MVTEAASVDCFDMVDFQRHIDKYRRLEDKIIFKLNCELPTKSFKTHRDAFAICSEIESKLENIRKERSELFARCLTENKTVVQKYHNDDSKHLLVRQANANLRQIRNEQTVDDIVIAQTEKVLQDRCRKEAIL
uniref:Coiled-coil domain-containing protein 58 n=1 Tax=Panagrolaimus sp. JU765 TaxID=591449 RepID=A0AC34R1Y1_9BILA